MSFHDSMSRLHYWLRLSGIPDAEDAEVVLQFPNDRAAHYAISALKQEFTPFMPGIDAAAPELDKPFKYHGVTVRLTVARPPPRRSRTGPDTGSYERGSGPSGPPRPQWR